MVEDLSRSSRPSTCSTAENIDKVKEVFGQAVKIRKKKKFLIIFKSLHLLIDIYRLRISGKESLNLYIMYLGSP